MNLFKSLFFKIIASLFVVYTVGGFFALPYYLEKNLSSLIKDNIDSKASVSRISINPFLFEVKIDGLEIQDNANITLLGFKNFALDVDPTMLFKKKLSFKYIRINDLQVNVDINKQKIANFQYILDFLEKNQKKSKVQTKTNDPFIQVIEIKDLKLINTQMAFKDVSKKEVFVLKPKPFDIKMNNISTQKNAINDLALKISSKGLLDLSIASSFSLEPLSLKGKVSLEKVNVKKLLKYVKEDLPFDINTNALSLSANYDYKVENTTQKIKLEAIKLQVKEFSFKDEAQEVFSKSIKNDIDTLKLSITKNNEMTYVLNNEVLLIEKVNYKNLVKKHSLSLKSVSAKVKTLSENKKKNIDFELSLVNNAGTNLNTKGNVLVEPLKVEMSIKTKKFDLKPYNSYVKENVNLDIKSAYLSSDLKFYLQNENNVSTIKLSGDTSLDTLSVYNSKMKEELFSLANIKVNKLAYTNNDLKIKSVIINKPSFKIKLNKDKSTNFTGISKDKANDTKSKSKDIDTSKSEFKYMIQSITLKDGKSNFRDNTLDKPYEMKMEKIQSEVIKVSSNKNAISNIKLTALIEGLSTLDIGGSLILADINNKTNIKTKLSNLDLKPLSSYSAMAIGNEINSGKLFLDLDHKIDKSQLATKNDLMIKNLSLGNKSKSEAIIKAPISLAVGLLKNPKGELKLSVPINGDINAPEFEISSVVAGVVTKTIIGLVSSPFKILAALVGSKNDDLSKIEFAYGDNKLIKTQEDKIQNIIKAMKERPNLKIKIKNKSQKKKDIQALKTVKFENQINNNKAYKNNELSKSELIQKLYIQKYTESAYKKLKVKSKQIYIDMQKKLVDEVTVNEDEFYALVNARGENIKEYFLKNGLDSKRVHLLKYEEIKSNDSNDLVAVELDVF